MKLIPPLDRPFRLLAFDWDGTAVASRADDSEPIRGPVERLLGAGVLIVVITGTNLGNVDEQFSRWIRGPYKRNLYLATNRGSEVYGFDAPGNPVLLWRRVASEEEERLLTETAEAVRGELVARTNLEVEVVLNRLNRRKVDLIPLPEWRDPPKSEIGRLAAAVESRLRGAGLEGGLRQAFDLAGSIARAKGLSDPRITSDVKHIEVGLTDKSDSVAWILRELARPRAIPNEDLLIGGDEFGPIAGFPGSDQKMIIPEAKGAVFVSVGPEPGGVPPPVIHLGGGPERFRELLAAQAALHPVELPLSPSEDPDWLLVEEGLVLTREHEFESLFSLANGYVGTRGSLAEGSALSAPATFVAGVFDVAEAGSVPALATMPDWTRIAGAVEGRPIRLDAGENLEHRRMLDLRQGVLWREWRHRDPSGKVTRVRGLRLASQADRHLLAQSVLLTPENYRGRLRIEVLLSRASLVRVTKGTVVAFAPATVLETPEAVEKPASPGSGEDGGVMRWDLPVEAGRTYRLDRVLCVETSRDVAEPLAAARKHLDDVLSVLGIEGVLKAHRDAWSDLWRLADVQVQGDPDAQRALRFAVYHLLAAANPEDERVSIGARALTGAAYLGHVFWDTEIFMLPFYTLTIPAMARALLMYRHHSLPAARAKAARLGYRGALYAWESADTGEEVAPPFMIAPDGAVVRIFAGTQEQHISADVAYGVWRYWEATGDGEFLLRAGAEILLETARFWASRVELGADGRYHIRGVIGPDEYHESVDDDAYTNGMAQWNLERGAEVAALLPRHWPERWRSLSHSLDLGPEEPREWLRVASRMYTGFDPRTGLFEQFSGYFQLEPIDLAAFPQRTAPMSVLLGLERVGRSQVVKQADVVMLICLLWNRFPPSVREANFRFYEPRTDHGSSLSPPIHALVAARLGDLELAERYFRQTAEIDLANNMGNAAGGVHLAALGGLWQAAVFGFAGLELRPEGPVLEPRLPRRWRGMRFSVEWRGARAEFSIPGEPATVWGRVGAP